MVQFFALKNDIAAHVSDVFHRPLLEKSYMTFFVDMLFWKSS